MWNNIIKLEHSASILVLTGNTSYVLGKGDTVLFWGLVRLGDLSIREAFHDLFVINKKNGTKVGGMGMWDGITRVWGDLDFENRLLAGFVAIL